MFRKLADRVAQQKKSRHAPSPALDDEVYHRMNTDRKRERDDEEVAPPPPANVTASSVQHSPGDSAEATMRPPEQHPPQVLAESEFVRQKLLFLQSLSRFISQCEATQLTATSATVALTKNQARNLLHGKFDAVLEASGAPDEPGQTYRRDHPNFERTCAIHWLVHQLAVRKVEVHREYDTYLLHRAQHNDLTSDEVKQLGLAAAISREKMDELKKLEENVLSLCCALILDVESIDEQKRGDLEQECAIGDLIVPPPVTHSLFRICRLAVKRQFEKAEQEYIDATLGNAHWRIGRGEGSLHMRRSLEKIQQNKISHLINNERAMSMLLAVKRLLTLARERG